jgi:hypothetical protein
MTTEIVKQRHAAYQTSAQIIFVKEGSVMALFMQPRSANLPYIGHASDPTDSSAIYRAMYASLAPRWLATGHFARKPIL